ncbi:Aspartyl/asparaginy/proline hydroxylase [uncultured Caudovirales phage]|uniref:Aspartyl/asparaginy/proline hydroxylase n=1 Tax=uncultured Caudovirales phage TaxID=2100421 RepID=A0A6J5LGG5_9CAUD|nr:Aspartyl/asparaginy/proline hydroxylase [uncultured Caudovirales phage]
MKSIPTNLSNIQEKKNWIINESKIPFLELETPFFPYAHMLEEAKSLDHLYVEHRGNDSKGWASLCIHGISSQHTDHYAVYPEYVNLKNDDVPYKWTEIAYRCPETVFHLRHNFPFDVYHRIRFMRLEPGGYILPHSDSPDLGLRAINISLNNPDNCNFMFENIGIVPFSNSGSTFMVANGYQHSVQNNSSEYRYHIIIHGYSTKRNEEFSQLVVNGYQSLIPSVLDI